MSPELVADWRARLAQLENLLARQPAGEWAWLWHMRRDILVYLLQRYGTGVPALPLPAPTASPPPREVPSHLRESVGSYVRSSLSRLESLAPAQPLRPPEKMRALLTRIASANQERNQAASLQMEQRQFHFRRISEESQRRVRARNIYPPASCVLTRRELTYPADGFALPNEQLYAEERRIMQVEADAIAAIIDPSFEGRDEPLTEEQIAAILSGG